MFGPHACIVGPLGHSLMRLAATCTFVRPQRFSVSTDNERRQTEGGFIFGMCVMWIMVRFHIKVWAHAYTCVHMSPSHRLKVRGLRIVNLYVVHAFPVCEACATSKLCIGYSNITQHTTTCTRWLSYDNRLCVTLCGPTRSSSIN
jgi:hypothetical protein